jgi:hypothetical protein
MIGLMGDWGCGRGLCGFSIEFEGFGEGFEGTFEKSETAGDDQSVIGDGDTGLPAAEDAAEHFSSIPHAGAAVNDEFVGGEVLREVVSLDGCKLERAANELIQPARDFDASDVVSDGMMGASFGDEDAVARAEGVDG